MRQRITQLVILLSVLAMMPACEPPASDAQTSGRPAAGVHVAAIVDAACGQCQFGLEGAGCDLAVRIDGKAYFVDGTAIDDHGDAHGADGFCNTVRQARVDGHVVNGRFEVQSFEAIPAG